MSHLKFPLKEGLQDPADEAAVSRMWQAIDARFPQRPRRRSLSLIFGPLVAVAAGVALVAFLRHDAGPLRMADGSPIVATDAPAGGARLALSDGSSIQLGAGARIEPIESSAQSFIAVLDRGDASFDVVPGGPRRWQIECGLATVEVVGTRFSCARGPDRLHVGVERGIVLVRGERVVNHVRRLAAGESLDVFDENAEAAATETPEAPGNTTGAAPALAPETAPAEPAVVAPPARGAAGPTWRELARSGHHREAFATLGAQGIRRESKRLGINDLFALADVARLSGHPAEAVGPLQRIIDGFPADRQAPLAAFALGRLQLDDLHQPRAAAASFSRALELGAPKSLREAVRARLTEAQARIRDER
ncbi:MAG TPA: FecR domain-containing protein [Polyangia bacterium]|nr:FecR domain-containing protein [Polyangia bacterium]